MTTLTIRIDEKLKSKAASEADKLGVSLTLIIQNALTTFVSSPKVVIGGMETMVVTPKIQNKMDKIAKLLAKR